jgi:hypothetical protein
MPGRAPLNPGRLSGHLSAEVAMSTPRNPLQLSTKAARYGAVALFVGLLILGWPVAQGWRMAGAGAEKPALGDGWQELRRFGWEMGMEAAAP